MHFFCDSRGVPQRKGLGCLHCSATLWYIVPSCNVMLLCEQTNIISESVYATRQSNALPMKYSLTRLAGLQLHCEVAQTAACASKVFAERQCCLSGLRRPYLYSRPVVESKPAEAALDATVSCRDCKQGWMSEIAARGVCGAEFRKSCAAACTLDQSFLSTKIHWG